MRSFLASVLDKFGPHLALLVAILLTTLAITCGADEVNATSAPPKTLPMAAAILVAKADQEIVKVRTALVESLKKAQADATKKGDLDGALSIKAKIEEVSKDLPAKAVPAPVEPHSSRDVIFYAEDNYGGQGTVVRAFNATTEVYTIGFPNDGLRSLKVPAGVTVIVFEGNLGGGASQEITHDMPTLQGVAALGMSSFKLLHTPHAVKRIIHQFWVGPYRIPKRERSWMDGVRDLHPDYEYHLWTDANLPPIVLPHIAERVKWRMDQTDYALAVDILKIYMVWHMGGIYLDADTEPRRGMAGFDLERYSGIFRHHGDEDRTISTDFGGMTAGHPLGRSLLETMHAPAYDFGPHWLGRYTRAFLGLPVEAGHNQVRTRLADHGFVYMPSGERDAPHTGSDHWYLRFGNGALFSWSIENRAKFAAGDYE